jgi:glycosyltransferase involved in cell wall biosynthesis
MNVLLLAPHPFYQDRGTPIAVNLVLRVLSERGTRIDMVTFHEGSDVVHDHVRIHRIPTIPFVNGLRPGFSWKKLVCDAVMVLKTLALASKNRYHVVHAVEEAVYIALFLKWILRIPYVYDMDSSMAQQMEEKYPFLVVIRRVLYAFERLAVRNADAILPVCEALTASIAQYQPKKVCQLHDVPLLAEGTHAPRVDLRKDLGIDGTVIMYVGNLEAYQGIDLLLESFALLMKKAKDVDLVIIGGEAADIEKYRKRAGELGIHSRLHFLGPKPIQDLSGLLSQADILVSPRIKGNNTPMKLYSYLHSGKAVVATALPTHTQVLNSRVAMLADPRAEDFSMAVLQLVEDESLRVMIGKAGRNLIEEKYMFSSFCEKLNGLYDWLEQETGAIKSDVPPSAPLNDKSAGGDGESAFR